MNHRWREREASEYDAGASGHAPGKRARTDALGWVQRKATDDDAEADVAGEEAPEQTAADTWASDDDPFALHLLDPPVQQRGGPAAANADDIHAAAARGTAGSATSLPFADRIQAAFGPGVDVGAMRAHVGGAATEACGAMGASAFARGNDVAFAGAPDLHTVAHEAAHVVQQAGGVQMADGVGAAGDAYEQHADAVADRVVAGRSAEDLLTPSRGAVSGTRVVQHKRNPVARGGKPEARREHHDRDRALRERIASVEVRLLPGPNDALGEDADEGVDGRLALASASRGATIVNAADTAWKIVSDNQEIAKTSTGRAQALREGVPWNKYTGWRGPRFRTVELVAKNLFGMEIASIDYRVSFRYGGTLHGRGRYLSNVMVYAANLKTRFRNRLDARVQIGSPENAGSVRNPIGRLPILINTKLTSVAGLVVLARTDELAVQGNGVFHNYGW